MRPTVLMGCAILMKCAAAAGQHDAPAEVRARSEDTAAGQSASCAEDAMDVGGSAEQSYPCSVCRGAVCGAGRATGDVWHDDDAYYDGGKCQFCGSITIHLGCALGSLHPVSCSSCGSGMIRHLDSLDKLIKQLQMGRMAFENAHAHLCALDALEAMDHSMIVLMLRPYDLTDGELESLEEFTKSMSGTEGRYSKTLLMIISMQWVKSVISIQFPNDIFDFVIDTREFAIALPFLDIVITPFFILKASGNTIIELIKFLAHYKGPCTNTRNALMIKIVDLVDIKKTTPLKKDLIMNLLADMIKSGSCLMIKHLLGRYNFCHKLTDNEVCAILEQYALKYDYDEETFMPLFAYLANSHTSTFSVKHRARIFIKRLSLLKSSAEAYVSQLLDKYKLGTMDVKDAIANYKFVDGEFNLSSDLLYAIDNIQAARSEYIRLIANNKEAGNVHIFRHIPIAWMHADGASFFNAMKEAIREGNHTLLEEILVSFANLSQNPKIRSDAFTLLLNHGCQDYAGLLLKIISNHNIIFYLKKKGFTDRILKQLVDNGVYWCIPYFKSYVQDEMYYEEVIKDHRQDIIDAIAKGAFRFSPVFREMVQYDSENYFLIKNLPDYIEALLKASTNRYTVQRLLIEIASTGMFKKIFLVDKMIATCTPLMKEPEWAFYLDAFYYALQPESRKICLKKLILGALGEIRNNKNQQIIDRFGNGILGKIKKPGKCSGFFCGRKACKSCSLCKELPFEDFIIVMRCVKAEQ